MPATWLHLPAGPHQGWLYGEREKRRPRKSPYRRLWCRLQWGCQSIDIILTCASAGHWQGEAESRGGLYEELCKVDIAAACLINPTYHYIPFFPDWVYLSFSAMSVSAYLVNSQWLPTSSACLPFPWVGGGSFSHQSNCQQQPLSGVGFLYSSRADPVSQRGKRVGRLLDAPGGHWGMTDGCSQLGLSFHLPAILPFIYPNVCLSFLDWFPLSCSLVKHPGKILHGKMGS